MITGQSEIGQRFCRTLGLDPRKVKGLDIHIHAFEPITADVNMYVSSREMELLESEIIPFELREIKKDEVKK